MLIIGAVVVAIVAAVLVIDALGGSPSKSPATSTGSTSASTRGHSHHTHPSTSASTHPGESSPPALSPAETHVAVLNGTSTSGLAHRLSASLQQSGYSQATPLDGTPPGSHQATVVEYVSGHHAEAAQVAQALGVSQVQPIEGSVSPLVGGATVVVIAGLDKAGAGGEPSSGAGGAVP